MWRRANWSGCWSGERDIGLGEALAFFAVGMGRSYSCKRPGGSQGAGFCGRRVADSRTLLLADVLGVVGGGQQLVELAGTLHPELDHPALAVGILVHQAGVALDGLVHLDHVAGHGAEQLGYRLHCLDGPEHFHPAELGVRGWQVHVHHVPQFALCVIGDADLDDAGLVRRLHVLVLFGVVEVFWDLGHRFDPGWESTRAKVTCGPKTCQDTNGFTRSRSVSLWFARRPTPSAGVVPG